MSALSLTRHDGVATLVLNRPEQGNAINPEMAAQLLDAAATCDGDETIRCVLLTGTGKLFCGGGDLDSFAEAGAEVRGVVLRQAALFHAAIARLARMAKPLVVAVNGPAAGAGLSLAVFGDLVLASTQAHFTFGYTRLGFSSDGGASWLLPRLIGLRRTQEFMLTNRRIGAQEAVDMGLVTRVVEDSALIPEALEVAQSLASGPTRAIGRLRSLLLASHDASLESQLEMEGRFLAESAADAEGREGIAAILAKRPARFS